MRQVVRFDGLLLRHLVSAIASSGKRIRRDDIAPSLGEIATHALADARQLRRPPPELLEGKRFIELLRKTASKRANQSSGPGVLEHRTSPRLEWLTDFGVLTKAGSPRNGFEYGVTEDAQLLTDIMGASISAGRDPMNAADEIAIAFWHASARFAADRGSQGLSPFEHAVLRSYRMQQRSVGPISIKDVSFVACLFCEDITLTQTQMIDLLVNWANSTSGVTLSGGRYHRGPELIHIDPMNLNRLLEAW